MSNIIATPLNKLTRSARNVRQSGGDSTDPVYAVFKLELAAGGALPDGRPNASRRKLTCFVPRVLEVNTRNGISLAWSRRMNQCGPHPNRF